MHGKFTYSDLENMPVYERTYFLAEVLKIQEEIRRLRDEEDNRAKIKRY